MPRIDDYRNARRLAVEKLTAVSVDALADRSGFQKANGESLIVPFLDRIFILYRDGFEFRDSDDPEREVPIQEQVLILHYLTAKDAPQPSGQWVSYREIPGASFYNSAFIKRAVDPTKKVFGKDQAGFERAAAELKGTPVDPGDAAFEFRVFPKVPLQIILYIGDEEFPPEANILFDQTIERIFPPEDIAWLAGMLAYRLIALSRG